MAKFQSPLLGYNTNIRHKTRVFHVQTEDSGVNHPHIITHLFMDGGRILKSVKTSYAEHLDAEAMKDTVREMMKAQHKAMLVALRDGQFDALVSAGSTQTGSAAAAKAVAPPVSAVAPPVSAVAPPVSAVAPPVSAVAPPVSAVAPIAAAEEPPPSEPDVIAPISTEPDVPLAAPTIPSVPPTNPDPLDDEHEPAPHTIDESSLPGPFSLVPLEQAPMTTRDPVARRAGVIAPTAETPVAPCLELALDFDALERAAHEPASPSLFQARELPPPPRTLVARDTPRSGAYRSIAPEPPSEAPAPSAETARLPPGLPPRARVPSPPLPPVRSSPPLPPVRPAPTPAHKPASRPPTDPRPAPARPAAIFGSKLRPQPRPVFNDEVVSDKSLDEVILSYLAEDLEPPPRRK